MLIVSLRVVRQRRHLRGTDHADRQEGFAIQFAAR